MGCFLASAGLFGQDEESPYDPDPPSFSISPMAFFSAAELPILTSIQSIRTPWLDQIVYWYSALGNVAAVWIVLALVALAVPRLRKIGWEISLALVLHLFTVNFFLKPWIDRVRPCDLSPLTDPLLSCLTDGSFPSGHTGAAFAVAGVFLFNRHPAAPWLLLAALLMGLSRLYLYVHFPSDVLTGAVVGLFLAFLSVAIVSRLSPRTKNP